MKVKQTLSEANTIISALKTQINKMKSEHVMELNELKFKVKSKDHLEQKYQQNIDIIEKIKDSEVDSHKQRLEQQQDLVKQKDSIINDLKEEITTYKVKIENVHIQQQKDTEICKEEMTKSLKEQTEEIKESHQAEVIQIKEEQEKEHINIS